MNITVRNGNTLKGFSGICGFVESGVQYIYGIFIYGVSVKVSVVILSLPEFVFSIDAVPGLSAVI